MKYAVIKDSQILCFSDKVPTKRKTEIVNSKGKVVEPAVDGMDYDEAIEMLEDYDYRKSYSYQEGKIVVSEEIIEEKIPSKDEILQKIGELSNQRLGLIELGEDTTEIQSRIDLLKTEYKTLTA